MSLTDHRIDEFTLAAWQHEQQGRDLPDLAYLFERPAWQADAACRGQGATAWFPELGQQTDARTFCAGCPVREECLSYALDNDIRDGFWGNTSARERRQIRRQRRLAA